LGPFDDATVTALARMSATGATAVLVGVTDPDATSQGVGAADIAGAVNVADAANNTGPPQIRGVIALADRVRPQAAAALRDLHDAGIDRIVMLTGDNAAAAQ